MILYKITENEKTLADDLTWDEATEFIDNIEDIHSSYAIIEEMK